MTTGQKMSRKGRENIRRGLKKYYARKRRETEQLQSFSLPEEAKQPGLGLTSIRDVVNELTVYADELDALVAKLSGMLG